MSNKNKSNTIQEWFEVSRVVLQYLFLHIQVYGYGANFNLCLGGLALKVQNHWQNRFKRKYVSKRVQIFIFFQVYFSIDNQLHLGSIS